MKLMSRTIMQPHNRYIIVVLYMFIKQFRKMTWNHPLQSTQVFPRTICCVPLWNRTVARLARHSFHGTRANSEKTAALIIYLTALDALLQWEWQWWVRWLGNSGFYLLFMKYWRPWKWLLYHTHKTFLLFPSFKLSVLESLRCSHSTR